jgi:hypothetical protein
MQSKNVACTLRIDRRGDALLANQHQPPNCAGEDMTKLPVDAVVNAATGSLLDSGGVDGAIHEEA